MDISEQILNLLRDNARISVEDISAMTKTSVDEVNAVIKKLEDDGVIMKLGKVYYFLKRGYATSVQVLKNTFYISSEFNFFK